MADAILVIKDLHVSVEDNQILKGVNLEVPKGEVHALMGPNGSGKSTLASVLLGHPAYVVTQGSITFKGQDVTGLKPEERAQLGMFLAFQYPVEVPGVSVSNFLRTAINSVRGEDMPIRDFMAQLRETLKQLGIDEEFARRSLNQGFSGGEKKRNEVLQLAMLKPEMAILDETDSGLDIDAVRVVADAVNHLRGPDIGFLVITHYMRILSHIQPDRVHVLMGGRVVKDGGPELAVHLEEVGYKELRKEFGIDATEAPEVDQEDVPA